MAPLYGLVEVYTVERQIQFPHPVHVATVVQGLPEFDQVRVPERTYAAMWCEVHQRDLARYLDLGLSGGSLAR